MAKASKAPLEGNQVYNLLHTLFKEPNKSPVAFRPARVVHNYLKRNLRNHVIPLSVVEAFEQRYVRENQINKNVVSRKFPRVKYMAYGGLDDIWQLDLIDLHANRNRRGAFAFALTKLDLFSKKADVEFVKRKEAKLVTEAFEKICNRHGGQMPRRVQTDEGKEFFNKIFTDFCKQRKIHHYKVNSEVKVSPVERFNRTFQTLFYRYVENDGKRTRLPVLAAMTVKNYNETAHTALAGLAPNDVNYETGVKLLNMQLNSRRRAAAAKIAKPFKYAVNQHVRIVSERTAFSKGYRGTYTQEIFRIYQVFRRKHSPHLNLYRLEDLTGEKIDGIFYEPELQKVLLADKIVSKVHRVDRRNKRKLVSFRDYPQKYQEWINA